jgi:hypothetical protein
MGHCMNSRATTFRFPEEERKFPFPSVQTGYGAHPYNSKNLGGFFLLQRLGKMMVNTA